MIGVVEIRWITVIARILGIGDENTWFIHARLLPQTDGVGDAGRARTIHTVKEDFLRLTETSPDLAMNVLRDFAGKLTHLTGLVEQLSLHSIRGRLARFLIEQANQGEVAGRWTQDEIAAHLGTVRDMVGRTLRAFTDSGMIRRERNRVILLDRAALEAEAEQ